MTNKNQNNIMEQLRNMQQNPDSVPDLLKIFGEETPKPHTNPANQRTEKEYLERKALEAQAEKNLRDQFNQSTPVEDDVNLESPVPSRKASLYRRATNTLKTFVKVSAVAVAAVATFHNFTTPSFDASKLNTTQQAAISAQEKVFSAGLSDVELGVYKAWRFGENILPNFLHNLAPNWTKMSNETRAMVAQSSLNKMLKDYPAYPEANTGFLTENSMNREVRANIMTNLIKMDHFNNTHYKVLEHLENDFFRESIDKFKDHPVNQTRAYPFKHADKGLVGTKIVTTGGNQFLASGRVDSYALNADDAKNGVKSGIVSIVNLVTVPIVNNANKAMFPLIKFSGMFSNPDALSAYTKDPAKTSVAGFIKAAGLNTSSTKTDNHFSYSNEDNNVIQSLKEKSKTSDGGEYVALSNISTPNAIAQMNQAARGVIKQHDIKTKNTTDDQLNEQQVKNILNNVKNAVSPDPNTVESARQKGLDIIEKAAQDLKEAPSVLSRIKSVSSDNVHEEISPKKPKP